MAINMLSQLEVSSFMTEMGIARHRGDPATFFGFEFEFSGKSRIGAGSGMYGMVYIKCRVHVCK